MISMTVHALRLASSAPVAAPIPVLGRDALAALHDLVEAVDRDGIAAHEPAVLAIVAVAEDAGIRPGLTTVLVEPASSAATRERAFAILALAIARTVGELVARTDSAA